MTILETLFSEKGTLATTKLGWVVQKLVNTNQGFNINQSNISV